MMDADVAITAVSGLSYYYFAVADVALTASANTYPITGRSIGPFCSIYAKRDSRM